MMTSFAKKVKKDNLWRWSWYWLLDMCNLSGQRLKKKESDIPESRSKICPLFELQRVDN